MTYLKDYAEVISSLAEAFEKAGGTMDSRDLGCMYAWELIELIAPNKIRFTHKEDK